MYNLSVLELQERPSTPSSTASSARAGPGQVAARPPVLRQRRAAQRQPQPFAAVAPGNPDIAGYEDGIDPQMGVLSFVDANGELAGAISWFPVHSTSMTNANHLISPDNKGYASYH